MSNHSKLAEIMVQNAELRAECERLKADNARLVAVLSDLRLQSLSLKDAERLASNCQYGIEAIEDDSNRINWGDAGAFFLEGWMHAMKGIRSTKPSDALINLLAPTIELLPQLQKLLEEYFEKDSCCCTEPGELCLYCEASNHLGPLTEELARLRAMTDQEKASKG